MSTSKKRELPVIGWREWIALPELGIRTLKAKVDTGARSSSLYASNMETFEEGGKTIVRFNIYPEQRSSRGVVTAEAVVQAVRNVRSSSGIATPRYVIITPVEMLGQTWPIELNLANREQMGFRMLLGRQAIRNRVLVDAGRSYYGGKPAQQKKVRRPRR